MEELKQIYGKVNGLLERLDYDSIWKGFSRKKLFLYQKDWVCSENKMFPWIEEFVGNSTIFWENEQVAIWKIEEETDVNDENEMLYLAANLVHEMFHAFQMERKEERFPNDLKRLVCQEKGEDWYFENRSNLLLAEAVNMVFEQGNHTRRQKVLLDRCMQIRLEHACMNPELVEQLEYLETAEGMAEYAGCMALKQLSTDLFEHRIREYALKLVDYEYLSKNERTSAYLFGTLLLIATKAVGYGIFHQIGEETRSLGEGIREQILMDRQTQIANYDQELGEREQWKKMQIEAFIYGISKDNMEEVEGEFRIVGYDPMNMLRVGELVLCKTFIRLQKENKDMITFFEPILLVMKPQSENEVISYKRKK